MNEEQEHANFSLRNTLYTNFESLLECICVEGILEVTQAQNAVNWGIAGEQVSMIILLPDKIYPITCRFILFLPALKPLAAQSFLHTRHVHTIATSTRGPLITNFSVFVITFIPINVIVFKVRVCSNVPTFQHSSWWRKLSCIILEVCKVREHGSKCHRVFLHWNN